jgi:hypothetical protein
MPKEACRIADEIPETFLPAPKIVGFLPSKDQSSPTVLISG